MRDFTSNEIVQYSALVRNVALSVWSKGTQKACAQSLGINPTRLSRILSGAVTCDSRTFLCLLNYVGFDILKAVHTKNGVIYQSIL